jgi:hypothetical protein
MDIVQFENQAAQGDMLITRIDAIPASAKPVTAESGFYILAHSETGHHHAVKERPTVKMFQDADDPMTAYLQVLSTDTLIEHQRSFDTHKTLQPKRPGNFKIRRQREAELEGWRKAQD